MTEVVLLDTAEEIARWLPGRGITPRQLRQWAKRGHITRYPGDLYRALEVADYLEKRPDSNQRRAAAMTLHCAASRRLTP